jgi:hypothetical protein
VPDGNIWLFIRQFVGKHVWGCLRTFQELPPLCRYIPERTPSFLDGILKMWTQSSSMVLPVLFARADDVPITTTVSPCSIISRGAKLGKIQVMSHSREDYDLLPPL